MAYRPSWRFTPGQQFGGGDNFAQDFGIMPGTPGEVTYGQIKRGPAPPQYRFKPPRAGVQANFRAPASGPLIDARAPKGFFVNLINQGADMYMQTQEQRSQMEQQQAREKLQQQKQQRRSGIDYARAKSRIYKRGLGLEKEPSGFPAQTDLPPPASTVFSAPTSEPSRTTLPPPVGSTPPSTFGAMQVPPMKEMGTDLFTGLMRTAPEVTEPPQTVQWKDEPQNPFPMGSAQTFDRNRMFDPTYKSSPITQPPTSRSQRRPSK